jgi:lipid-binding SYLF domain-containing protein
MNCSNKVTLVWLCAVSVVLLAGCSNYRSSAGNPEGANAELEHRADHTIREFDQTDTTMRRFFDSAHGYAVFPSVGKGAVGVGGARGRGVVYEQGQAVGYTTLTQANAGTATWGPGVQPDCLLPG